MLHNIKSALEEIDETFDLDENVDVVEEVEMMNEEDVSESEVRMVEEASVEQDVETLHEVNNDLQEGKIALEHAIRIANAATARYGMTYAVESADQFEALALANSERMIMSLNEASEAWSLKDIWNRFSRITNASKTIDELQLDRNLIEKIEHWITTLNSGWLTAAAMITSVDGSMGDRIPQRLEEMLDMIHTLAKEYSDGIAKLEQVSKDMTNGKEFTDNDLIKMFGIDKARNRFNNIHYPFNRELKWKAKDSGYGVVSEGMSAWFPNTEITLNEFFSLTGKNAANKRFARTGITGSSMNDIIRTASKNINKYLSDNRNNLRKADIKETNKIAMQGADPVTRAQLRNVSNYLYSLMDASVRLMDRYSMSMETIVRLLKR